MLADGQLSYFYFPRLTPIDELLMENKIVDFQIYQAETTDESEEENFFARDPELSQTKQTFLATLHNSFELKLFSLKSKLEFKYITRI